MLFKYSGKYVNIYFNMKITFHNNNNNCVFFFRFFLIISAMDTVTKQMANHNIAEQEAGNGESTSNGQHKLSVEVSVSGDDTKDSGGFGKA